MLMRMTGEMPLMMHNVRLADRLDPYARAIAKINAKKQRRTDDDFIEISRLEFAGGIYHDEELGPYLPGANIFKCLIKSGGLDRGYGAKVERGLIPITSMAAVHYTGPRDVESLWGKDGDTQWVDRRMVKVGVQTIGRTRPIFRAWSCEFEFELDTSELDLDSFVTIAERAGRLVHVGEYRRFYGRFKTEVFG